LSCHLDISRFTLPLFCLISFLIGITNIELLIEPYQTVALVGRSGSGKSTLVKLIYRYFEPNAGQILLDGRDIRQLDIAAYRRRLAIVHQEVDVFNGSLLDNLTYGNRGASFEQVEQACAIARLDEVIGQLPEGYFTVVGERGVRLSGGQRQRLGIARVIPLEEMPRIEEILGMPTAASKS
jgi:ATP-binding cassette subfamily B protein